MDVTRARTDLCAVFSGICLACAGQSWHLAFHLILRPHGIVSRQVHAFLAFFNGFVAVELLGHFDTLLPVSLCHLLYATLNCERIV